MSISIIINNVADICQDKGQQQACGLPSVDAGQNQVHDILQIVFAILAAISVLFIVISSLRFITSQGNPQEASKARATIAYALVGLIIALLAEAIVAFTLDKLG